MVTLKSETPTLLTVYKRLVKAVGEAKSVAELADALGERDDDYEMLLDAHVRGERGPEGFDYYSAFNIFTNKTRFELSKQETDNGYVD